MSRRSGTARQSIDNLRGEVTFRAKLAQQHVTGDVLLPEYYRKEEHDTILRERVRTTRQQMGKLQRRGVRLSPFLELGAERGQRSLVLTNHFGAQGVAIDISFHQLRTAEYFARLFQLERLPLRICCDANYLPFKSRSFPFVFCYEFLHHFPSLGPVVAEIRRVLADGFFFFDEEPFRRVLKVRLYRQKEKIYSQRALRKNAYIRLIHSFFSEPPCDEVEHGIIENNEISLREWAAALATFDAAEVDLLSLDTFSSRLQRRIGLRNAANYLLGGTIRGLCRKQDGGYSAAPHELDQLLACPSCTIGAGKGELDRPALARVGESYRCPACGFDYPVRDGILMLLPREELRQLYPELGTS